jgi:hypothetical protein
MLDLLGVRGIGQAKASRYGDNLLRLLAAGSERAPTEQAAAPSDAVKEAYETPETVVTRRSPAPIDASVVNDPAGAMGGLSALVDRGSGRQAAAGTPSISRAGLNREEGAPRPTHYWTWRLLSQGFSLNECAAIRNLDSATILRHALQSLADGLPVDARWCLTAQLSTALQSLLENHPDSRNVDQLHRQAPPGTSREAVALFLECLSRPPDA